MLQSLVVLFLYPDNLKDVLQQLYKGEVRSPSISVNVISFSYFDTVADVVFYTVCHDCFLQFGCQKCVERCIIGALYSLPAPVKRLLFLNVSMGTAVMSQAEIDGTEEIKMSPLIQTCLLIRDTDLGLRSLEQAR